MASQGPRIVSDGLRWVGWLPTLGIEPIHSSHLIVLWPIYFSPEEKAKSTTVNLPAKSNGARPTKEYKIMSLRNWGILL
jgi:hypothetical protein